MLAAIFEVARNVPWQIVGRAMRRQLLLLVMGMNLVDRKKIAPTRETVPTTHAPRLLRVAKGRSLL